MPLSLYSDPPTYTPSTVPLGHPQLRGHTITSLGKYGPSRGASPPSPSYILVPNFPTIFWHQIGKYNFFHQTLRSIVNNHITKVCLDTCIIVCFAILNKFISQDSRMRNLHFRIYKQLSHFEFGIWTFVAYYRKGWQNIIFEKLFYFYEA